MASLRWVVHLEVGRVEDLHPLPTDVQVCAAYGRLGEVALGHLVRGSGRGRVRGTVRAGGGVGVRVRARLRVRVRVRTRARARARARVRG